MVEFSGMCIGGPCDGQMVVSGSPYYRVALRMPSPVLYDERAYIPGPIGTTSVDYRFVTGLRFPGGQRMDFFLLREHLKECDAKRMDPAVWVLNHIFSEYRNTRVDT